MVVSESGEAIEAATIYLLSSSLLGVRIGLSDKTGFFDFPGLPPGRYRVSAEKPGFKTVVFEDLELRGGATSFIRLTLAPSEKERETVVTRAPLIGDTFSAQPSVTLNRELIERLPFSRDFDSLLRAAPGVFISAGPGTQEKDDLALLGSAWRNTTYRLDGINITDNLTLKPLFDPDVAIIEELEVTSAGQPLSHFPAGGTHVRIVSRSGGNKTSGNLGLLFISNAWNKDLWTSSQMAADNIPSVAGIKNHVEPFLSLGGPFWRDRAWFFLSGRFFKQSQESIFIGPFQDISGQLHSGYDWSRRHYSGFFKVTTRPIAAAQMSAWVNLAGAHQPVAEDPSPDLPRLSTHLLDKDNSLALYGAGHYFLDQNTIVSAKASFVRRTTLALLQEEARSLFWSDDAGDRYGPFNGADYNAETSLEQLSGEASARKFVSNWAGMRHILSAGFSYLQTTSYVDWWRENNLLWFRDSRRAAHHVYPGLGLVGFWMCGSAQNTTLVRGQTQRLGGYISDTFTLGKRLTLSLSLRLDRIWGGFSGSAKATSGNPLAFYVGEAFVKPSTRAAYPDVFAEGLNPWASLNLANRDSLVSWLSLSPRFGLVLNLWGEGKALLKASYARYRDDLTPRDLLPLHPFYPGQLSFFWLDANGDGRPESSDEYTPLSFDFRLFSDAYFEKRVAEEVSSPLVEEISLGGEQFIGRTFSLGLRLISRHQKNILADVLYDPDSGKPWYEAQENGDAWLPFTTTIPANGSFPAQKVTIFVRSKEAPPLFFQWGHVTELERKYRAVEFTLEKRFDRGWQFSGALILSKTEGNAAGFAGPLSGIEARGLDPNYFVNRYGRLASDRPVLLKLQAAVELPLGFLLSAFYQYQSGEPWQRRARILPPADWCEANGGERLYYPVYLESAGSRRQESFSFLDGRLEKTFALGETSRVCLTLDVLNLLGGKRAVEGLNDVDVWEPSAEGEGKSGDLTLSPDYQKVSALMGKRVLRFSLRLSF